MRATRPSAGRVGHGPEGAVAREAGCPVPRRGRELRAPRRGRAAEATGAKTLHTPAPGARAPEVWSLLPPIGAITLHTPTQAAAPGACAPEVWSLLPPTGAITLHTPLQHVAPRRRDPRDRPSAPRATPA